MRTPLLPTEQTTTNNNNEYENTNSQHSNNEDENNVGGGGNLETTTNQQTPINNWRGSLKDYVYGKKSNNPKPKRTQKWKRCLLSCIRLPWTAFFLLAVALAIVIFFGVIISGKAQSQPTNTTLYDPNTGKQVEKLTIPCDTDVSDEVCETIIANVAATKDFQQTVTESHLFITLGVFWLATSLYLLVKAIRARRRDMYLTSLPHPSVWFENPAVWRGEADVGSGSRSVLRRIPVQEQMHRSITLTRIMKQYDPLEAKGDLNWEKVYEDPLSSIGGAEKEIHWPTLVGEGWTRLVDKACQLDPLLNIKRENTVREFVLDILAKRVNDSRWELIARRWVDTYERVKFGDAEVYQHDCEMFFDDFHMLRGKLAEMIEEREHRTPDFRSLRYPLQQQPSPSPPPPPSQQPPPPSQQQQQQQRKPIQSTTNTPPTTTTTSPVLPPSSVTSPMIESTLSQQQQQQSSSSISPMMHSANGSNLTPQIGTPQQDNNLPIIAQRVSPLPITSTHGGLPIVGISSINAGIPVAVVVNTPPPSTTTTHTNRPRRPSLDSLSTSASRISTSRSGIVHIADTPPPTSTTTTVPGSSSTRPRVNSQ